MIPDDLKIDFMWNNKYEVTEDVNEAVCFYARDDIAKEWLFKNLYIILDVGDFACRRHDGSIISIDGVTHFLARDEIDARECRTYLRLLYSARSMCLKTYYIDPIDYTGSKNLMEDWGRMCRSMENCENCTLYSICEDFSPRFLYKRQSDPYFTDDIIKAISNWSAENPV